jgi:hypothetical protein
MLTLGLLLAALTLQTAQLKVYDLTKRSVFTLMELEGRRVHVSGETSDMACEDMLLGLQVRDICKTRS